MDEEAQGLGSEGLTDCCGSTWRGCHGLSPALPYAARESVRRECLQVWGFVCFVSLK